MKSITKLFAIALALALVLPMAVPMASAQDGSLLDTVKERGYLICGVNAVSYTHLTLPTNREV